MQPEVRDHEPDVALFGGTDGLGIIARLVGDAAAAPRHGGYLIFEFGLGQDERHRVARRGDAAPLRWSELRRRSPGHLPDRRRVGASRDARLSLMNDCLFCQIVNREIPASIVYEDDRVLAFNDINPQAPTHVLIVPKRHIASLNDLTPDDDQIVGELVRRAAAIAKERGHRRRRLPHRVQHQPRRRPDGLPRPPAPARRPGHALAAGIDTLTVQASLHSQFGRPREAIVITGTLRAVQLGSPRVRRPPIGAARTARMPARERPFDIVPDAVAHHQRLARRHLR